MNNSDSLMSRLISSRRTIHHFQSEPVPDITIVKQAIELACWAPNHHLTEPWHFYLLKKETVTAISELNRELLIEKGRIAVAEEKYRHWMTIPGWLVVTCEGTDDQIRYQEDYAACCCVIQNFMLLLWEQGIGTKWSTSSVTRDERFYAQTWINREMENIIGLIWYGYPADIPQTTRKPLQQVLTELP